MAAWRSSEATRSTETAVPVPAPLRPDPWTPRAPPPTSPHRLAADVSEECRSRWLQPRLQCKRRKKTASRNNSSRDVSPNDLNLRISPLGRPLASKHGGDVGPPWHGEWLAAHLLSQMYARTSLSLRAGLDKTRDVYCIYTRTHTQWIVLCGHCGPG